MMVMLSLLAAVALADVSESQAKNQKINCVNNLHQIGLAYRVWAGDNGDKYPMQVSVKNGGAKELVFKGNVAACFQVMSNELSTPKIVICPADTSRSAANNFTTGFDNSKVDYFVGVDADLIRPQMLLSGDDNFAVGGVPVKPGLLVITTSQPITWTAARHVNQGNIGFADGQVWQDADDKKLEKLEARLALP